MEFNISSRLDGDKCGEKATITIPDEVIIAVIAGLMSQPGLRIENTIKRAIQTIEMSKGYKL